MPYIVDKSEDTYVSNTSSITAKLPTNYSVDDLLIICVSQDGGGTVISTPTGWTLIATQSQDSATRQAWFYKIVTVVPEVDPVFTGSNDQWTYTVIAIRDVDTTTPIHLSTKTAWSGAGPHPTASLTTTTNDCLILYSFSMDYAYSMTNDVPSAWVDISKLQATAIASIIGYKQQQNAGIVPIINMIPETSSEGGARFTIAIKNKTGGSIAKDCSKSVTISRRFGLYDPVTAINPSTIITGTIDGVAVWSSVQAIGTASLIDYPWNRTTTINIGGVATTGEWLGTSIVLPVTTDWTNKILSISFSLSENSSNRFGEKGIALVLSDSLNNWVAYQLAKRSETQKNITVSSDISIGSASIYDSSGAYDITDITNITILAHKVSGNTQGQSIKIRDLLIKDQPIFVSGSSSDPITPGFIKEALDGEDMIDNGNLQGSGQGISKSGIQLGDGITKTYVDFSATSYETPILDNEHQFADLSLPFIIYASPTDNMLLTLCGIVTTSRNNFTIHSLSSTSATYDFSGASIVNWNITWRSGITCNGANITNSSIIQNNGIFDGCKYKNSKTISDNPDNIINGDFVSGGTGHGVEIVKSGTGPLTINYSGNTDSGYALVDGSTGNETILINPVDSTADITLNILNGGTIPSIMLDPAYTGILTVIVSPVTLKIIVKNSDGTLLTTLDANVLVEADSGGPLTVGTDIINGFTDINGEIQNTQSYSTNQPIKGWIRKSTTQPFYKQFSLQGTIDKTNGLTLTAQMIPDE